MRKSLKKGFTMVEMVVTLIVISVVAVTTVAGLAGWYNSTKDQGYRDDAEGIVKAYHEWYGVNVGKIASETAEQALYDFAVQKNGISFYNYDSLRFNYTFKDDEESGEKKAYLLYEGNDYACSIALDIVRMSATNDLEAFHLSYTDNAYAEISKDYSSTLFNIGVNECDTVLGVYNNNIGRKVVKMVVTHDQTDEMGNKIVDTLYARPGRGIVTNKLNKTVYDLGSATQAACLKNKNGQSFETFNGYSFSISNSNNPSEYVENVELDGYDKTSNVVIYNTENWTYNDSFVNESNLANYGAIIKFSVTDKLYKSGYTVRKYKDITRRRKYDESMTGSENTWLLGDTRHWWVEISDNFNQIVNETGWRYDTVINQYSGEFVKDTAYTRIKSFDTLDSCLSYIYGNNNNLLTGLTGSNGLYGTYSSTGNTNLISSGNIGTASKSYSNSVIDMFTNRGIKESRLHVTDTLVNHVCYIANAVKTNDSRFGLLDETTTYYNDFVYKADTQVRSFNQDSFELYLGTCTIDKNITLPKDFKVYLPFNYATVTENSSTYLSETNAKNYGKNYYLADSNNQTYVSKLYRTYGNSAYTTFAETNKITINEGVTLDCSNAKLIVGGLMLPNKEGFNSKLNVGNHAAIYNNGKIILGSQGLECYGFIYGNGTIERKSGISQTTIKERSSMLDYTNDADVNTRFMSKKFGGKWPKTNNIIDICNFLTSAVVDSSSDFQQAYIAHSACEKNRNVDSDGNWFKIIGEIHNIVDSSQGGMIRHDYIELDKPYSMPMVMKYDSTAIQCTVKLNANDKYIQKYFVYSSTINQFYDFDYNLFGQSYETFNDDSMDSANLESKMKSAIFNIQTGTLYKTVSSSGKMIFETSNARVVNNDNFTYWAYFDSNEHYSVSGSFAPVALYNTEFNFSGTSSLDINCSDLWVLPSAKLSFSDSARLGVGSKSDVKGYCDIWTSPGYAKRYTAHGNIAMFKASDLYKEINISRNIDKELLSYNSLENGKLVYTSSVTPTILDNSNVAGDIYCNMNKFSTFMSHSYDYSCSYMPRYGEGNRDLGSGNWIYSIEANCIKL